MYWLSKNISTLFAAIDEESKTCSFPAKDFAADEFDLLIIGSGYGGSIVAARASEALAVAGKKARIGLLEKGREYVPGEFPSDLGTLPKHLRVDSETPSKRTGDADALINVLSGEGVTAIVGQALGGTSQINANVAHRAPAEALKGWAGDLNPYYANAEFMLVPGSATRWSSDKVSAPSFAKDMAFDRAFATTSRPRLAVHFEADPNSSPGNRVPARACTQCGNCITGCNYGSKNSLTQTYLPVAFRHGVEIYTGAGVSRLYRIRRDDMAPPDFEWLIEVYPSVWEGETSVQQRRFLKAKKVLLAAGAIGSTEILLRSRSDWPAGDKDPRTSQLRRLGPLEGLKLSPMLGKRVSGNGDGVSFSYWEKHPVEAMGAVSSALPGNDAEPGYPKMPPFPAGPTITRMTKFRPTGEKRDILVQNAVAPGAIAEVLAELLCSVSMTGDLAQRETLAEKRGVTSDPIALHPAAIEQTQILLTMGDDGAPFTMRLDRAEGLDRRTGFPKTEDRTDPFKRAYLQREGQKSSYHESVDNAMRESINSNSHCDGRYVSNPVLNPIDDKLSKLLAGAKPGGGVVTVHPLGGCAMADDPNCGVVSQHFQVFECDGPAPLANTKVYASLYVCDGAVFPKAIGVNPFLTIAALAEKLGQSLGRDLVARSGKTASAPITLGAQPFVPIYRSPDAPTKITFSERLRASLSESGVFDARDERAIDEEAIAALQPLFYPGKVDFLGSVKKSLEKDYRLSQGAFPAETAPLPQGRAFRSDEASPEQIDFSRLSVPPQLVLNVKWKLNDVGVFLRGSKALSFDSQNAGPLSATLKLEFDESRIHPQSGYVWPDALPNHDEYILKATKGSVVMFDLEPSCYWWRKARGLWNWALLRGFQEIIQALDRAIDSLIRRSSHQKSGNDSPMAAVIQDYLGRLCISAQYAANASQSRKFKYRFEFESPHTGKTYELKGEKQVTFHRNLNPWRSITEIPEATLTDVHGPGVPLWRGQLSMDVREVVRSMLPEASDVRHMPDTLLQVTKFGAFVFRAVIQANIWHFRKPDYKPFVRRVWDYPGDMAGLVREPFDLAVPKGGEAPWQTPANSSIRLTRYRMASEDAGKPPVGAVLMLHGLLHSAACFSTRYIVDRLDPLSPVANLEPASNDPQNMVEYFCANGYECWLLDMRVSTANLERKKAWTLDQVANGDLPTAIKFVRNHLDTRYPAQPAVARVPLNVFAHCMGAAVMSMAVLNDKNDEIKTMISKLVLCQFGPFMVPSSSNLARTQMVSVAKDFLGFDSYNPVTDEASTAERRPLKNDEDMFRSASGATLFDRLAWSYPVDARDAHGHQTSVWTTRNDLSICNRLSLMIGENWVHQNISEASHANLEEFIGPTRIETFWQTLYFGLKGRVVSYEGDNRYVTDEKLTRHFSFPVLFLHGQRNGLFHPRSTFLAMQRLREYASSAQGGLSEADAAKKFQYFLVEGYGHLENVIGKDANKKVFPRIAKFFES